MTLPKPKLTAHEDIMTGDVYLKAVFPYQEVRAELGGISIYREVLTTTPREHIDVLWGDAIAAVLDKYVSVIYGSLPTIIQYLDTLGVPEYLCEYKDDIHDLREQFDAIIGPRVDIPYIGEEANNAVGSDS